uniref:Centrosomin N-terminal motif 1 domain-containing protein n=1 Tax=Oryzias latipes TaxID=8090 RepID=A0A3P9K0A6_ORYLA
MFLVQKCPFHHLNDLKKENFSLKLRIYFLEEKIQQKFEASSDDIHRRVSNNESE